jgi:lipoate-protein ligase A
LSGPLNMGLDEALLEAVIAGAQPAIRFYTWLPATLSLGTNQPFGEMDPAECARRGFSVVRRITGGRAVLHQHELTYSVIAPENDPRVSGGVVESYRKISAVLVDALNALGAPVTMAPANRDLRADLIAERSAALASSEGVESAHAVCFDAASDYELLANGKKLVGSAQARRGGVILQHGSILLDIDWEAWAYVFAYRTPEGRERALQKLPSRMTSLGEVMGKSVIAEQVEAALAEAFAAKFGLDLKPSEPLPSEWGEAERLAAEKYGNDAWTMRK